MRIGQNRTGWLLAAGCLAAVAIAVAPRIARADFSGDGEAPAVENTVRLEIHISGVGAKGARVAIKPAHPGCQFKPVERALPKGAAAEVVKLDPIAIAAKTTAADRDCSFEITITEPGQEPKTFRRGLRLSAPPKGETAAARTLKCYLSTAAVAAKEGAKPRR